MSTLEQHHRLAPLHRRREAAHRLPPLVCRCTDPWPCRHSDAPPTEHADDAWQAAAATLLRLGLPPAPDVAVMRRLWRRGGAHRRLVAAVAERWELAA